MTPQPRRRPGGLALFGGAAAAVVIGVGIVGDVGFFERFVGSDDAAAVAATAASGRPAPPRSPAPVVATPATWSTAIAPAAFEPPAESAIPDGELGAAIRLGRDIVTDTPRHAGAFVGNDLSCSNCHLDAGRRAGAAPFWAAHVAYPAWRAKTDRVDTLAMRMQECFRFSMNGREPPADAPVLVALQAYAGWLATGATVGRPPAGGGFPALDAPASTADARRGRDVYAARCAACHGADGLGTRAGDRLVAPPLWGDRSFNAGAGMARPATAAAFIGANMPLGQGGTLSVQETWDVAAFVLDHPRPADPRAANRLPATTSGVTRMGE